MTSGGFDIFVGSSVATEIFRRIASPRSFDSFVGAGLAAYIFQRIVSGKSDVTLRNWRGVLVYFFMGMGGVWCVKIVRTLMLG